MKYSLTGLTGLFALVAAQGTWPSDIVGTWSTKSNKTLTGPGFYDPLNDEFIEPERTGISYSFTEDGHYESAYYRAIANPQNPACPSGIMQWQHGSWVKNPDGGLTLKPIKDDGRQLLSEPCEGEHSIYTRYNQTEEFEKYEQIIDAYHNIPRLNLYKFDGSPMNPMYLAYRPPQMLPTTTLNPIAAATGSGSASSTATGKSNSKRGLDAEVPLNWKLQLERQGSSSSQHVVHSINADRLWWLGLGMTGLGGLLYMGPRRMGIRL